MALAKKKSLVAKTAKKEKRGDVTPEAESVTEAPQKVAIEPAQLKVERYFEAVGRRKTATARVRLYTKGSGIAVNSRDYTQYFSLPNLQRIADAPLRKMKSIDRVRITALVSGSGLHAQAEAVRHGIARALVVFNPDFHKRLKRSGYLKRDPRMKERKKYGLKKARKAPRWSKR